jgi:hypothetical protein
MQLRDEGDPEAWYVTWGADITDYGGDYIAAAGYADVSFSNFWLSRFYTSTTLEGVRFKVGQDGGPPINGFYPLGDVGTSGTAKLPQNCALLIDKFTARPGRTGKGRMFMPGVLREGDVNNVGVLTSAFYSEMANSAGNWLEDLAAPADDVAPPQPMVLLHNEGVPGGTSPTPVVGFVPQHTIATQRRRLRK